MKKRLFLLVVFVLTIGLVLSACSDSGKKSSKDKKDDSYEIKWYTIGTPQKDTDKVFEKVNEYTKEKINATVNMTQIDWGDYEEKMQVIISSGEKFDLAFTNGTDYIQDSLKGAFEPVDDLLDSHGEELKEVLHPDLVEGASINGELFGIPSNKEVGRQTVFTFNKRLVEEYDFDISTVKTIEDLEPMFEVIKENEPNITPLATHDFKPYLPFDYIMSAKLPFAVPFEGDTDTIINFFETDIAMETFKTMHKYYKAGYVKADAATSTDTWPFDVENWFVRMPDSQPYADLLWSRSAKYDVISTPAEEPVIINESVTGAIQAISVTSENPEKVMEFLNLLNTDAYLRNLVDKGLEDVHYTKNDDDLITDLEARIENYNMPTYSLGNHFNLYLYEDDPVDKWDAFEEFNDEAVTAPTLGFHFDSSPVRTEIAAISNVSEEYFTGLATGTLDPEEYIPIANEKFEKAGLQKVIDEIQEQYDAWKDEVQ